MKIPRLAILPVVFTGAVVVLLFVPIVLDPNFATGTLTVCNPNGCVTVVQYDSVSYAYGGWGAYYQTGVNHYTVQWWMCSCPPISTNCCVPPFGGLILAIATVLLAADIISLVLVLRPSRNE